MTTRAMILIVLMVGFQQILGETVDYAEIARIAFILFVIDFAITVFFRQLKE